jgi:NAD-dependent dihydropyrimidine dehydrogenase PreA subunit
VPYAIGEPCIDVLDRTCVEVCPVDCIYEGERKLYIHPDECIDCGVCMPVCPVEAIRPAGDFGPDEAPFAEDNVTFFRSILRGHDAPLGSPGGSVLAGTIAADTPLVAEHL